MKRPVVLCLVLILFAGGCLASSSARAASDPPVLTVPHPTWDFGESDEDAKVSHDFVIRNTGKGELRISEVKVG